MKPVFLSKDDLPVSDSFIAYNVDKPFTSKQYHYHDGFELLYNIENSGVRCVGDSIERFERNDLVLIGQRIPHFWHSDDKYFGDDPGFKTEAIMIQFGNGFLSKTVLSFKEFAHLHRLIDRTTRGIQVCGNDAIVIGEKIKEMSNNQGWRSLLMLVEILSLINEAKDYRLLSSTSFKENHKHGNEEKISRIFNFMVANYNRDLTLEEVSESANMCESALCRFLKKNTTKTFSQILNEIRIGFACKSLLFTDNSISEIAFNSGYNNIGYFNKQFKRLKELTPNEYRQQHLKMLV